MWNLPLVPEQASDYAKQYDLLFYATTGLTIFFTVAVSAVVLFFVLKYRKGSTANRAGAVEGHLGVELVWTGIPLLLGLAMFVWAAKLYADSRIPPDNALDITVIGKQWMWHIQHPNGVRENNELHVPAGQPIKLTMISQDVIHSFFLPQFRVKQDVLPGRYTHLWFTPTKPGKYHLFCAEYCGMQHSEMGGYVYVMEPKEYQEWLAAGGERRALPRTPEQAGKQVFEQMACGQCHGDVKSERGMPLAGTYGRMVRLKGGKSVKADEAYLRESLLDPNAKVVDGYWPIMPSYKGQLTEEQILHLIAYLKSLRAAGEPAMEGASSAAGSQAPGARTPAAAGGE